MAQSPVAFGLKRPSQAQSPGQFGLKHKQMQENALVLAITKHFKAKRARLWPNVAPEGRLWAHAFRLK